MVFWILKCLLGEGPWPEVQFPSDQHRLRVPTNQAKLVGNLGVAIWSVGLLVAGAVAEGWMI